MAVWMVRAGKHGEWEDWSLGEGGVGRVAVAFGVAEDLSGIGSREEMASRVREASSDLSGVQVNIRAGQLWRFREVIKARDTVVLPLKTRSAIAVGEVTGPYEHQPASSTGAHHTRRVEWLRDDIPRSSVDQDILYSLGSLLTVCAVKPERAEERLRALAGGRLPAPLAVVDKPNGDEPADDAPTDIAQAADDAIREHIGRKFQGHELERLIEEILKAEGYETWRSPVGADGGVDILAGNGPMGFDSPRLVVQVKSGAQVVDVKVLRELRGAMQSFNGEQGLLVSWGGFKDSTRKEARQDFFKTRLWDDGDVVEALLDNYEKLSPDLQKEIPLKRIWTLVQSDVSVG